ncbi:MAG: hypothetical protein IJC94_04445, partial [Oscillospiraceae bacterium]|nr:hypothetical protein [Oscillospiraceae bacterium]
VTGAATVLTVLLTNNRSNRDMNSKLEKSQAVTDTKLDELTREVRLHNSFAQRIPVVEEQIKAVNRRINDLEKRIN